MKVNKSLLYLLPLIKGWSDEADTPVQCYADTEFPDCIIARYLTMQIPHSEGIINKECDGYFEVIHLIRQHFIDDYKLILKGKYSKISEHAKSLILSKVVLSNEFKRIEGVLYKNKSLKQYLENKLNIPNLDEYIDEYESIMGIEEKLEAVV
jgi:hypothetical protein